MKLTKRGKQVRAVAIAVGIYLIWQVATKLWWTGVGFCWGDVTKCLVY
jgi:hypothetical protein